MIKPLVKELIDLKVFIVYSMTRCAKVDIYIFPSMITKWSMMHSLSSRNNHIVFSCSLYPYKVDVIHVIFSYFFNFFSLTSYSCQREIVTFKSYFFYGCLPIFDISIDMFRCSREHVFKVRLTFARWQWLETSTCCFWIGYMFGNCIPLWPWNEMLISFLLIVV